MSHRWTETRIDAASPIISMRECRGIGLRQRMLSARVAPRGAAVAFGGSSAVFL
jgi:hypothetical protein